MKNETGLQLFFILIVAIIVSLGSVKFLPEFEVHFTPRATYAQNITTPLGEESLSVIHQKAPPTSINIKPVDLTLPVAAGVIYNNEWTLYDDKISWLATSEVPGKGNVILYGHNRLGLFADLKKLKTGDIISIEHGAKWFDYEVVSTRKVLPTEVDAVFTESNQLTLYTCDGKFDQKRLVVTAIPLSM